MLGTGNTLQFKISRTVGTSADYYVVPYLSWDNRTFYEKTDNGTNVTLSAAVSDVTIRNIALTSSGNTLYTKVRIYDQKNGALVWEGPSPVAQSTISKATIKTVQLDDNYSAYQKVDYDSTVTYLQFNKPIPANKVLVVSYLTRDVLRKDVNGEPLNLTDSFLNEWTYEDRASSYIKPMMTMFNENQTYAAVWGSWFDTSRMTYYKIVESGNYNLKVEFNNSASIHPGYMAVYMVDYIPDGSGAFEKLDSLGRPSEPGMNNYAIINTPEHLFDYTVYSDADGNKHVDYSKEYHMRGEQLRYIAKVPVNGEANIYWEHLNKYTYSNAVSKPMRYGLLLQNTSGEDITITVNNVGAATNEDTGYHPPLEAWRYYLNPKFEDPRNKSLNPSLPQRKLSKTIKAGKAEWLYLQDVTAEYAGLMNGIINISVPSKSDGTPQNNLFCYAFIMEPQASINDSATNVLWDFNNGYSGRYQRADSDGYTPDLEIDGLTGTSFGPILKNNLGRINLSSYTNNKYKLLLTGAYAPFWNAGELMPLYYGGKEVRDNAINYSVIYKMNIDGFDKDNVNVKIEYNPFTNNGALSDSWGGAFMIVRVNEVYYQRLVQRYTGNTPFQIPLPDGPVELEIICSGMSGLPVTVIFEEDLNS